jgi:hypothetical protein
LRQLSGKTGITYSYLTKLAQGHKSLERLSDVYRKTLAGGLLEMYPQGGEREQEADSTGVVPQSEP